MVEGGGSDDFRTVKSMAYARPDLMQRILDVNVDAVAAYLNAQIEAGAQAVMIFDTWGGTLADGAYQRLSLDPIRRVVAKLKRQHDGEQVPVITFTKGGGLWLEEIAASGVDAVGLDWTVNLGRARERVNGAVALQGNLDPNILFAPPATIRMEARARCSTATATIPATCSISATASRSSRRRKVSPSWSTRCIAIAARCARVRWAEEVARAARWRGFPSARAGYLARAVQGLIGASNRSRDAASQRFRFAPAGRIGAQAPVDRHFPACQDLTYTHFARCGAVERRVDKTSTLLRRKSDSSLAG